MCDIKRCFNQSKCSLTCKHEKGLSKHEKGLSKHEKGLSEHEKGLSDLNQSKMYRQFITKGSKSVFRLNPIVRCVSWRAKMLHSIHSLSIPTIKYYRT